MQQKLMQNYLDELLRVLDGELIYNKKIYDFFEIDIFNKVDYEPGKISEHFHNVTVHDIKNVEI